MDMIEHIHNVIQMYKSCHDMLIQLYPTFALIK